METGAVHIKNLEVSQLQATVSKYPWFSYAREVLLCRMVQMAPECLENSYKENLIFFPRRDAVLLQCRALAAAADANEAFEIDFDLIQQEVENFASGLAMEMSTVKLGNRLYREFLNIDPELYGAASVIT